MSKRSYKSGRQQARNEIRFAAWVDRLHDVCLACFRWSGLPFGDEIYSEIEIYLNEILYQGKTAAFGLYTLESNESDPQHGYIPIIGEAVGCGGLTWYGGSYEYQAITKNATFRGTRDTLALCRPTAAGRSMESVVLHYADVLSRLEMSIDVNVRGQNTPVIIQSPPGQELTYANMFEQVAGYKPVVYGREGLLNDKEDGPLAYRYLQPAVYTADRLEMLKHDILNDFYNEIGISSKSIEKKAQLITDELYLDYTSNSLTRNIFMDPRREFCKQMKAIFGLPIECTFNADILDFPAIAADQTDDREGAEDGQ